MKRLITRTVLGVLILLVGVSALPLFAQTPPPQTEAEKQRVAEEMVVTARKKEETVQEVPMSVAAPTEAELRDRGAETIEDVAANVAGFSVQNLGPGQSQIAIRGVSAGQIARDQPGVKEQVGVYLDESVISLSLFTPDIDLFDLSRVEVLRGPQGTLFGSGSLSGTVRYITNQPRLRISESVAEVSLNAITDGSTGGSVKYAGNVPLGDRAAMRLAADYTRYGGYMDAVTPSLSVREDVNSGDRIGGRVAFLFQPSDKLSITPRLLYQKIEMDGWNRIDVFNILGNPYTTTRPKVQLGNRQLFLAIDEPFTDEFMLGDLNIEYDFGAATLTSITSYTDRDILVVRDAGALTASITGGSIGLPAAVYMIDSPLDDATTAKGLTQEVRLSGGANRFDWVAGVFYADMQREYGQNLTVAGFQAATNIPTRGLRAPTDSLFWSDLSYDLKQLAVFGEGTLRFSDRVEVTGGLRWYDFDEDRDQIFDGIFAHDNTGTQVVSVPGSTSADGIAPRVMASFKLTDNTRINAQVSKGFRLGGINDPLNVPLCTAQDLATFSGRAGWEDETLWNYEVGAKSTFSGGRGTLNGAVFYSDIENFQAVVTAGSCSSRLVFNVPKARVQGLEAELSMTPNDNFDFAISATRTDSELRSTLTSTDAQGRTTVIEGIEAGNRFPSVPEFQASAAATVRTPMGRWIGYATGVYQHIGDRYTQILDQTEGYGTLNLNSFGANTIGGPLTQSTFTFDPKLPAYNLINLRFGVLVNNWDTALFINNVTDETAYLSLDRERGLRARVGFLTNQPRTFGISTRVHF